MFGGRWTKHEFGVCWNEPRKGAPKDLVQHEALLLLHDSTVLVGTWPPSRPSSSRLFCVHVSSSLWHTSSSGPPSRLPSTLTLVFLHSYFLLECSDITSLPPYPHLSSLHVPAISIFLCLFLLLCPILHIIVSLLHLFCSSSILLHILDQIFFSAPSFPNTLIFLINCR